MSLFTFNFYIYLALYVFLYLSAGYKDVLFFIRLKSNTRDANLLKREYADFLFLTAVLCFALSPFLKGFINLTALQILFIALASFKYFMLGKKAKRVAVKDNYEQEKYCFEIPDSYALFPNFIFMVYLVLLILSNKGSDKVIFTYILFIIPLTIFIFTVGIFIWRKISKNKKVYIKNAVYFISYSLCFFTVIYLEFILKSIILIEFIFGCLTVFLAFLLIAYYIKKERD